jgi:hypothetical protein
MAAAVEGRRGFLSRIAPALLILVLAPLFAEELPGATRLSTLLAFPPVLVMETIVWGGAALMLRGLARKLGLGWGSLMLFGLVIAVAEEFVIQQTSFAPLVIKLKGVEWARAGGINYVYALWALVYEAVWVVLLPTLIAEMVFPDRKRETWLSRTGTVIMLILFAIGSVMAWFAWTHVAREQTFHVPAYNPPLHAILIALAVIAALFLWAIRFPPRFTATARPPAPAALGILAAIWAALWYILVVLAFGVAPQLSAPAVFAVALIIMILVLLTLPRWAAHPAWTAQHAYGLAMGALVGSMLTSFIGFQGAAPADLWFKIVIDLIAFGLMILLGRKIAREERGAIEGRAG